jgi:outer membrane protein, multidrug efflux system
MRRCAPVALALLLAGCMLGPNYHRPAIDTPAVYRGATAEAAPAAASLGAQKWSEVFHDPVLQQLIRTALRENYDVRVAAARVLEAQAQLGITRSNEFPTLNAGAESFTERNGKVSALFPAYDAHATQANLSAIWNLDLWGKYRRETETARANWLASEWGQRVVLDTVVSSVASTYFQIRELDLALQIARDTLSSRQSSLHLTQVLAQNGSASLLDVRQSEQLVYTAAETIPNLEQQLAQQEDLLSTLLGHDPADVPRGLALTAEPTPASVPAGLPSELLERRPDIRQAEQSLVAANAEIGVAKAALFPSISLTGSVGFESDQLQNLFSAGSRVWSATGTLTQPVFQAGALRAGLQLTRAQQQEALLIYKETIINAFREVSDALVAYRKSREYREQQEALTSAAADTDRLSNVLYQHGGASYLQVLTAETNYFAARLNLAQAQLNERLALVQLYNALGGGWQE